MKSLLAAALLLLATPAFSQKYLTRTGRITFFSATPAENIEAVSNDVASVIDAATGDVAFAVPIKSFRFEKALMQEHFNENYLESSKYPKADFKGRIEDAASVRWSQDGSYPVKATGKLTLHGVTRDVTVPGTIVVKGGKATVASTFKVRTADYGIKIPGVVSGKIAQAIEVTLNSLLSPAGK